MSLIYVPAEGPSNARLAVIGEAPGGAEERQGRPFVGPTGEIVDSLLKSSGLARDYVYLTNVVKVRPPGNNIKALGQMGKSIEDFLPQLHEEIRQLNPNAILALGNTALEATTGNRGIEKWRGSILPCIFHDCKVIPTIHPASLLHGEAEGMSSWKDITFIKWDFERAIKESQSAGYTPPERDLLVCRSSLQLYRFLQSYKDCPYVATDIETFKTFPICISFAFNSHSAISVPLFNFATTQNLSGMTRSDVISCWEMVAELLANPRVGKVGQNFKFDQRLLETCLNDTCHFGFKINSYYFDTMLAFRTLYPELPSSLAFQGSVLTREPYYKDEGKEYNPKKDKFDRLLLYNAKDAVVTYECFEKEMAELEARGLSEFFFTKVMPLHPFYMRLEKQGILVDKDANKALKEKYNGIRKILQDELNGLTKEYIDIPVNVSSNGPRGQVPRLLYGLMKLPVRRGTDEKSLDGLMRNVVKEPNKRRIIELILEIRKVRKTIGTYIDAKTDHRGKMLTGVNIALETGRSATRILKTPVTTEKMGLAFQTITKHGDVGTDFRSEFVPTPGFIFIEPDLSGAEARVVALLAKDKRLIKIFEYDLDIHRITTGWIFGTCPNDLLNEFFNETNHERCKELRNIINKALKSAIDDELRQIGKKFRHAGHYDMGKREAAIQAGISEYKANIILTDFHKTNENIRGVFHREIKEFLRDNNRMLTSPHGRQRQFLNKWGDDLFKEAYAQIPQATVSDHNKFACIRIEKRAPWLRMLLECHDSFLAEVPIATNEINPFKYVDKTVQIIKEEYETPINFAKCSLSRGDLIIPCEIKIGEKNWEVMRKIA